MSDLPERVRLEAVAQLAEVSRATASKALNGRADVSVSTRKKVLAAAAELGYRGPAPADDISLVAWVVDSLTTTYTLDILRGGATAAMAAGIGLVTHYTDGAPSGGLQPLSDEWFTRAKRLGWLGVVIATTKISKSQLALIRSLELPVIAIDPANALPTTLPSIGATNWNGGVDATAHLIGLGHRRIGFIHGASGSVPVSERLQGYLSALSMHSLPFDSRLVSGNSFSHEEGVRAGMELLNLPADIRPTAVFASSDTLALGVYTAARQLGLSIPDDLSVVGFDDTLLAGLATPGLTTVRQPLEDMGATAVRTVVDLASGRTVSGGPIRMATTLVERDSTAQPAVH